MTTDLSTLTDDQLRAAMVKCEADLHEAANIANNTEWHEACFAALYVMCQEANRRCLDNAKKDLEREEKDANTAKPSL